MSLLERGAESQPRSRALNPGNCDATNARQNTLITIDDMI